MGYQRFFQLHLISTKKRGQRGRILFMNKRESLLFCGNPARPHSRIIPVGEMKLFNKTGLCGPELIWHIK